MTCPWNLVRYGSLEVTKMALFDRSYTTSCCSELSIVIIFIFLYHFQVIDTEEEVRMSWPTSTGSTGATSTPIDTSLPLKCDGHAYRISLSYHIHPSQQRMDRDLLFYAMQWINSKNNATKGLQYHSALLNF